LTEEREVVRTAHERARLAATLSAIADEYADRLAAAGNGLDDVGGVETIADLVRAVLPRPNRFAARVGPVYSTGQLTRLLPGSSVPAITDEAVRDRQRNGRLIGFKTADGRWAWPAWQFRTAPGRVIPRDDVMALWRHLPTAGPSDLTRIAWMTGEHDGLDGLSPLGWLNLHGLDDRLRAVALRWAGRLSA
jgi:hypothetical protein